MVKPRFFDVQDDRNQIKTTLVTKYFGAWATIMLAPKRRQNGDDRIAYIDLFSGPGRFEDGSPSTPLLILQQALDDERLRRRLVTKFTDKNPNLVEQLRWEVSALADIQFLQHPPDISHQTVSRELVGTLRNSNRIPSLFFIDPWGYKGLSAELIGQSIRNWGCDCIFFFNYNRVNQAVTIESVTEHIDELFGHTRAEKLRQRVADLNPIRREAAILSELSAALSDVGGQFSLAFRFRSQLGARTSHYIVFVTKSFRGYDIMKDIMTNESTDGGRVKRFEYVPVRSSQPTLFSDPDDPYSVEALKRHITSKFSGTTLTVLDACEKGSVNTPCTSKNVKEALMTLESEGRLAIDIPAAKRVKGGKLTLGDARVVTIPH